MRGIAERVEQLLGQAVVATTPVAGGDICTSTRVRLSDGTLGAGEDPRRRARRASSRPRRAGCAGWPSPGVADVAEVLAVEHDCLVLRWIEPARPTPESRRRPGPLARPAARQRRRRRSAPERGRLHRLAAAAQPDRRRPGRSSTPSGGCCPTSSSPPTAATSSRADADAVEALVGRITELAGPEEPPARIHGDLWSGNVVWSTEHGHPDRPRGARRPPGDRPRDARPVRAAAPPAADRRLRRGARRSPTGWQDRQPLHQLFPLLVHAALFGGHYGHRAGEAAARLTG